MEILVKDGTIMAKKKIPFKKEFNQLMLDGKKTMTSRTKKYGDRGDIFFVEDQIFTILLSFKIRVGDVANKYFKEEGFTSPEEFIKVWKEIHPRKGYDPDQMVWGHHFIKGLVQVGQRTLGG